MQSIGYGRAQATPGMGAESVQGKEEGSLSTRCWNILEHVTWMLSEVSAVENLKKKRAQNILEYCLQLGNHYLKVQG